MNDKKTIKSLGSLVKFALYRYSRRAGRLLHQLHTLLSFFCLSCLCGSLPARRSTVAQGLTGFFCRATQTPAPSYRCYSCIESVFHYCPSTGWKRTNYETREYLP